MKAATNYFFNQKQQLKEVGWFRNALYLFLLYKVVLYVTQFDSLFSNQKLIHQSVSSINWLSNVLFFLTNHYSVSLAVAYIICVLILSIVGLLGKSNYITNFLLWFTIINLSHFLYPIATAGDYLLNQLLLFNVLFSSTESKTVFWNDVKTLFHNTALVGMKIQICVAYLLAALFKLTDASWLQGDAVYNTFQIPQFSNYFLESIPQSICFLLTYLTLAYQLLFAVLVWFRPLKIYLLSFGVLQHLVIALGMGLFSFGWIMIICYILFLQYDDRSKNSVLI